MGQAAFMSLITTQRRGRGGMGKVLGCCPGETPWLRASRDLT